MSQELKAARLTEQHRVHPHVRVCKARRYRDHLPVPGDPISDPGKIISSRRPLVLAPALSAHLLTCSARDLFSTNRSRRRLLPHQYRRQQHPPPLPLALHRQPRPRPHPPLQQHQEQSPDRRILPPPPHPPPPASSPPPRPTPPTAPSRTSSGGLTPAKASPGSTRGSRRTRCGFCPGRASRLWCTSR